MSDIAEDFYEEQSRRLIHPDGFGYEIVESNEDNWVNCDFYELEWDVKKKEWEKELKFSMTKETLKIFHEMIRFWKTKKNTLKNTRKQFLDTKNEQRKNLFRMVKMLARN